VRRPPFPTHFLLSSTYTPLCLLDVLRKGVPYLPSFIYFMGIISSCGITMTISILSDLLAFLTVHIYLCYQISRVVYYQQFNMARSLWNLFRGWSYYSIFFLFCLPRSKIPGKRYNVLRNRIDPWDYDMDQLLFGTMLFTLLAFLFPTVLAYYSLFAIVSFSSLLSINLLFISIYFSCVLS
jgi:phosphatidylinositol glycan class Q protein